MLVWHWDRYGLELKWVWFGTGTGTDRYQDRYKLVSVCYHALLWCKRLYLRNVTIASPVACMISALAKTFSRNNSYWVLLLCLCMGCEISPLPWRQGYCAVRSNQTILNIQCVYVCPKKSLEVVFQTPVWRLRRRIKEIHGTLPPPSFTPSHAAPLPSTLCGTRGKLGCFL